MRFISLLEFQPGLNIEIVPPSSYLETTNGTLAPEKCRLITDQNGYIVSEKPVTPQDKKILLLSGSSIENLYIPSDKRILSHIEALSAAKGKQVKVYNAAISNAHLLHMINLLLNKGIGLRPHIAVFYPTLGLDVVANEIDNSFWNPQNDINTIKKKQQEPQLITTDTLVCKNGFADEKRLLRVLYDICRTFGIQLVIATWPLYGPYDSFMMVHKNGDESRFSAEEAQFVVLNEAIRDFCREVQCPLLDLAAHIAKLDHGLYFYDRNHPNIKGCELIGSLTAEALQSYL